MAAALADDEHAAEQHARYAARRTTLRSALEAAGFRIDHSEASLYLWATRDQDCWDTVADLAELGILVAPGTFYGAAGARSRPRRPHRHRRARRRGGRPPGVGCLRRRACGDDPRRRHTPDSAGDDRGARRASRRNGRARGQVARTTSAGRPGRPRGPTSRAPAGPPGRPGSPRGRPRAARSATPGPTRPPSRPRSGTWHGNMNSRRQEGVEQTRDRRTSWPWEARIPSRERGFAQRHLAVRVSFT